MADCLKVALAQLNPKVGDVSGNLAKVRAARAEARKQGAELVLTSELVLSGYPPEDLVLKPAFQKRCHEAVEALRADTMDGGPALFVATPWREGDKLHNALICLDKGEIIGKRFKVDLPNYGVFDEKRVFAPGPDARAAGVQGRAHRRADLRGRVDARRRGVHLRDRWRDPAGAQWLAV